MRATFARTSVVAVLIAGVVLATACASTASDTAAVSSDAVPAPALDVDAEFQPFDTPPTLEKYVEPEYPAYSRARRSASSAPRRCVGADPPPAATPPAACPVHRRACVSVALP